MYAEVTEHQADGLQLKLRIDFDQLEASNIKVGVKN